MPGTARYARLLLALLVLPLALASCTTTREVRPAEGGLAPAMVIERFLRAANTNDLDTMARLFGTVDGPIVNQHSKQHVDDRMFVIASVLRHSDYRIVSEEIVPGRRDVATQLNVSLTIQDEPVLVPFTLVTSGQGWLIEQIAIERITQRR